MHADSLTVEPVEFKLERILSPLTEKYSHYCQAQSLNFNVKIEGEIPELFIGDSKKVFQILDELLSNAVKFTTHGSVSFSVGIVEKQPTIGDEDVGICSVQFSVCDSGIGIKPEEKHRVFSLFDQADNSNTRQYGGVGLGLCLSNALAEMLGGEISFTSTPGVGSLFHFILDLGCKHENVDCINEEREALNQRDVSILVVEDNVVNQKIMRGILKSIGYQCRIAENGEVALDMLGEERFHLIFMDCQMPIKDGFETTKIIRSSDDKNRNIPIVAVTANAMSGDRERCLSVGMNEFLQKPFKRQLIQESINRWLKVNPDKERERA